MSVMFFVLHCRHGRRSSWHCPQCEPLIVDMANANACLMMQFIGIRPRPTGTIRARLLASKCRRALPRIEREEFEDDYPVWEREYCRLRVRELLELALVAGSSRVGWV